MSVHENSAMSVHRNGMTAAEFRRQFPVLSTMTYLAACSGGPSSPRVAAALLRSEEVDGLGWPHWEEELAAVRSDIAELLHAPVASIATLPNATLGAYQAASGIDWRQRPWLLTSSWEFPSVAEVWHRLGDRGAEPHLLGGPDHSGAADLTAQYLAAIDDRTGLVSIPYADYRTGARLDVRAITRRAHEAGATVFVDAYQVAGTLPVDVSALGCDFLVTGTGKYLLGRPGIAFLYAGEAPNGHRPALVGWQGRANPFDNTLWGAPLADDARAYQIGTPAVTAAYAARAGLALLAETDLAEVRDHIAGLVNRATELLEAADEDVVTTPPTDRGAIVAITAPDPGKLATALYQERRVVVSPRGDVVRAAFHFYNDDSDVTALAEALSHVRS